MTFDHGPNGARRAALTVRRARAGPGLDQVTVTRALARVRMVRQHAAYIM